MPDNSFRHQTGDLPGSTGETLFTQRWIPEAPSRGRLLVITGLGEHSGRFNNLVESLIPLGYSVFSWDHPGHGRSEGTPGHIANFAELLDPALSFLGRITEENPLVPTFIFGHSMGGLLAVRLCQVKQPDLAGVILSSPSFSVPDNVSPLTLFLGSLTSRFLPRLPLSRLDPKMLSRDPEVVSEYQEDPLVYTGTYTARLGVTLLNEIERAFQEADRFQPPLLTLIGEQDQISLPEDGRRFHEQAGSKEKTLISYPEDHHELINEPDHQAVLADIAGWMDDRAPSV